MDKYELEGQIKIYKKMIDKLYKEILSDSHPIPDSLMRNIEIDKYYVNEIINQYKSMKRGIFRFASTIVLLSTIIFILVIIILCMI